MILNEEEVQLILWHLDNSLDRCAEETIVPPAGSDGLLHVLSEMLEGEPC